MEEGTGGVFPLFKFDRPDRVSGIRGGAPSLGAGNLPPVGGIGGLAEPPPADFSFGIPP